MAEGNNRSFIRDPRKYLRGHHLMVSPQPIGSAELHAGTMGIDLVPIESRSPWIIRLEDYNKRPHTYGSRPVTAWFLPAKADDISTLGIDSQCDFLFTADLSGCMFAAYGEEASGPLTVMHVNTRSGGKDRMKDHLEKIAAADHPFFKILSPTRFANPGRADVSVYPGNVRSCVVGVRTGGRWRFYYRIPNDSGPPTEAMVPEL